MVLRSNEVTANCICERHGIFADTVFDSCRTAAEVARAVARWRRFMWKWEYSVHYRNLANNVLYMSPANHWLFLTKHCHFNFLIKYERLFCNQKNFRNLIKTLVTNKVLNRVVVSQQNTMWLACAMWWTTAGLMLTGTFCTQDKDMYGYCAKCNRIVEGEKVGCIAMEQTFHIACFVCIKCSKDCLEILFFKFALTRWNTSIRIVSFFDAFLSCAQLLAACESIHSVMQQRRFLSETVVAFLQTISVQLRFYRTIVARSLVPGATQTLSLPSLRNVATFLVLDFRSFCLESFK